MIGNEDTPKAIKKDILKSPLFSEVSNIRSICSPLKLINIDNFFFHRIYPDGFMIHLSTDVIWGEYFLNKLFLLEYDEADINNHLYIENNVSLWEMNAHNQVWHDGREKFNVGNGISVLSEGNDKYKEISCFYASRYCYELNNFYLNNLDILQNFIMFFKEQASALIATFEQKRICLPRKYKIQTCESNGIFDIDKRKLFLSSIKPKKFLVKGKILTEKEVECLYWFGEGKTSEEIGVILSRSKRTVEKHIEQIKEKVECYTKSDLIKLVLSYNIKNFF